MIRPALTLAALALLSGCAWVDSTGLHAGGSPPSEGAMLTQLELISVINTRKTIGDHVAGWITGKDCSTVRAQREGVYCTDRPGPPAPPQQVYCYASLARNSCFSQPYNEGNDRLVGFVPAPTPIR